MNAAMPGVLAISAVACVLLPPVLGLFFRWLHVRRGSADCDALSCQHAFEEISRFYQEEDKASGVAKICAVVNMLFTLLALCMLALQMNLLPAIFLQAFAALAPITGALAEKDRAQIKEMNDSVREFILFQLLLFAAAVGFFLATGSFSISHSLRQPGLLLVELPFLTGSLLCAAYVTLTRNFSDASGGIFSAGLSGGGAALATVLAAVYRVGFFLLLAALLLGGKGVAAAVAAAGIYAAMSWAGPGALRLLRRYRVEKRWSYVLVAVGINLIWLYIKYL